MKNGKSPRHTCTINEGEKYWKRSLKQMKLAEGKYHGLVAFSQQYYFCVAESDSELRIKVNYMEALPHTMNADAHQVSTRSAAVLEQIHMNPSLKCIDNLKNLPPKALLKLIVHSFVLLGVPPTTYELVLFPLLRILTPRQVEKFDDIHNVLPDVLGAWARVALTNSWPKFSKSAIDEVVLTYDLLSASASFKMALAQRVEKIMQVVKDKVISVGDGVALAIADCATNALLSEVSKSPQFNFISVVSTMIMGLFVNVKSQADLDDALQSTIIMFSHIQVRTGLSTTLNLVESNLDDLFDSCAPDLSLLGQLKDVLFGDKGDAMAYKLRVMKSIMLMSQPDAVKQLFA